VTLNRRMTITAAIAVVLSSTILYPLFTNSVWFAASVGAVIAAAGTGALTRLRSLPVLVCLAAGVAGLLLYLNLVFETHHSWLFVIPTPASITRLWQLAGAGLDESRRYAPPAPNLHGLLLLAAAGVGITAVVTDLVAVRLRSAALAGLPLLVLFTVPVMMDAPQSQLTTPLVFCLGGAGYLAMLSADGRERIRVWGRLISLWRSSPWHETAARRTGPDQARAGYSGASYSGLAAEDTSAGPRQRVRGPGLGPDTRALAAAGRRVGLASIVLALCAPLLIPGLHANKIFGSGPGIGGKGGSSGTLTLPGALSEAIAQLHESRPEVVFTYTTSAPKNLESNDAQYFRQYVFDTLGGSGWAVTNYTVGAAQITSIPAPQGLTDKTSSQLVKTSVTVTKDFPDPGSQPTFLPLPYPATQVEAPGRWLADPDLMVYSSVSAIGGQTYSVASYAVDPSLTQLDKAPALKITPSLVPDLQLPPSYQTSALKQLAKKKTSGAKTELGKVNALANWLSAPPYVYSLNATTFDNSDGLLAFLTQSRVGYCVQYAYAMTVLTRLLGIPARFVVGYTAGTPSKAGASTYEVKNTDAHAWTEVYFPTFGWVRFEPTPGGQGTASSPNYTGGGPGTGPPNNAFPILAPTAAPTNQASGQRPKQFGKGHLQLGPTGAITSGSGKSAGTPWAAIALAVIAAIALAWGVISIVAPPAHRVLSAHTAGPARQRGPVTGTSVVLIAAAAALVALALYRLLSRTSRLDLGAGWATVGIAFAAAGALALVSPAIFRTVLRRWRWMHATDDASRAHAAWREFHDDLADYGVASRPSEPPRTLAGRVTTGLPESAGVAVRRLALAEERASYAARPSGSQDLRRDGTAARRGLAASAGRGTRWRARLFPASLMTALADGAAHLPDRATTLISRRRAQHSSAR
jgi:transglutaminase-like putative cysteine protease